jgi:uncharacterized membrane protein YdfJ with MMPL/SSD domain
MRGVFLGCVVACAAPLACQKYAEPERSDMEQSAANKTAKADGRAPNEAHPTPAAVRQEQDDFRVRIRKEVHAIERDLTALNIEVKRDSEISIGTRSNRSEELEISELLSRRTLLNSHLDAIDRAASGGWPSLRARLERDLNDGGALGVDQ